MIYENIYPKGCNINEYREECTRKGIIACGDSLEWDARWLSAEELRDVHWLPADLELIGDIEREFTEQEE